MNLESCIYVIFEKWFFILKYASGLLQQFPIPVPWIYHDFTIIRPIFPDLAGCPSTKKHLNRLASVCLQMRVCVRVLVIIFQGLNAISSEHLTVQNDSYIPTWWAIIFQTPDKTKYSPFRNCRGGWGGGGGGGGGGGNKLKSLKNM